MSNHQHRSIIMERNGFINNNCYPVDLNELRHAVNQNSRLPPRPCPEIYVESEREYHPEQVRALERENTKLRQQLMNSNAPGSTFQQAHPPSIIEKKICSMEEQLASFISLYTKDRMQMHRLVDVCTKMEDLNEKIQQISMRIGRMEENNCSCGSRWADVHDYGDLSTNQEAPLYHRRADEMDQDDIMNSSSNVENSMHSTATVIGTSNTGNGYPTPYNDELLSSTIPCPITATITLDRRQSDSTTSNTIESGYCDDRDEVFENLDQGTTSNRVEVVYEPVSDDDGAPSPESARGVIASERINHGRANSDSSIYSKTVIRTSNRYDEGIEFVAEFVTPKRPGAKIQESSALQSRNSKDNEQSQLLQTTSNRRQSVFASAGGTKPTAGLDLDFDDDNDGFENNVRTQVTLRQPLDPVISNLNSIFGDTPQKEVTDDENSADDDDLRTMSIKRKKLANATDKQQKRIRGISKAPIKREPGTISIYSKANTTTTTSATSSSSSPASPPLCTPPRTEMMQTLRNIKKERVAHAVDGCDEEESMWRCICGHQTTTKNGMKLHVKHMGTEEARYKCPWGDCEGRFVYPFLVRNHLIKDHKDKTVPDKLYGCEKCYTVFYDKNNLRSHTNEWNEICKTAPRRRPIGMGRRPVVVNPASAAAVTPTGTESPNRPSIIITL